MGAKEGFWWEGVEESSSISHLLIRSSARQCYFEMKTNMELYFSILSSIILCIVVTKMSSFEDLEIKIMTFGKAIRQEKLFEKNGKTA